MNKNRDSIAHHFIQDFKKKYEKQDLTLNQLENMRSSIQNSDEDNKEYKIKAINELIKREKRND